MKNINLNKIYGSFEKNSDMDLNLISSKLKKTALLTPAVAAMAVTGAVAEEVCYDGAPIVIATSTFGLDLNSDGLIDFVFDNSGGNNFVDEQFGTTTGGALFTNLFLASVNPGSSFYSAANLPAGFDVNSSIPSSTCFVSVGTAPAPIHFNSGCDTLSANSTTGNFVSPAQGYMGVTFFDAAGDQFFGWIELEVTPAGMTILNYGYDDEPLAAIETGESCEEGVPTMGEWGLMTLMLLFLSFGTVFMFKRREEESSEGKLQFDVSNPSNNFKRYFGKK